MQELEPTWGRVTRAFWFLAWRFLVATFLAMVIESFVLGPIFFESSRLQVVSIYILWPIFALLIFKSIFRKRFPGFRIALIVPDGSPSRSDAAISGPA